MRLTVKIGDYWMDQVILDLGSNANVLLEQTWECTGKATLQWYMIQWWMAKQQNILPMGQLQGVMVDINGVNTQNNFEVIDIVDDDNPYPALLRIYWATDMKGIINLKRCKMKFKKKSLEVLVPLDPVEGEHYIGPICDEGSDELDWIY